MPLDLRVPSDDEEEEEYEEEEDEECEEGSEMDPDHQLFIDEVGRVKFEGAMDVLSTGVRVYDNAATDALLNNCGAWAQRVAVSKQVGRNKSYSRGSTYWIASNMQPQIGPEKIAQDIFKHHTKHCQNMNPAQSGAEWWTLSLDHDSEVGWHWDKDYGIEASMELNVYPQVGTVTYFTNEGVPTVVADLAAAPLVDDTELPDKASKLWVSYPTRGRHFAFDGRFLHAAKEINHAPLGKKATRVTLLVNVWVNHKPVSASRYKGVVEDGFVEKEWSMSFPSCTPVTPTHLTDTPKTKREYYFTGPAGQRIDLSLNLPAGCEEYDEEGGKPNNTSTLAHNKGNRVFEASTIGSTAPVDVRSSERPQKKQKMSKK